MNGYGPTETTITATAFAVMPSQPLPDDLGEVPIGRPLAHARTVLRACDGSLTPMGGTGMLWIGGPAVTGGYLGDLAEAQAFQPDPWVPGGGSTALAIRRGGGRLGNWSSWAAATARSNCAASVSICIR